MRATVAVAACLAVLLLGAGCGGGADTDTGTGARTWDEIGSSLAAAVDRDSANPCTRGDPACLDAVLGEMDGRLAPLAAACDHAAPFAFMYREVTAAVADAGEGFFRAPEELRHLDAVFAALYFEARDHWLDGKRGEVPEAWRVTFEAGDGRRVTGIGDMLLGMNAHINRDLPFALAAISRGGGHVERADYDRVNELLAAIQAPMLRTAARRFDRTIDDFALPALDVDDASVSALISTWRTEAWISAQRLVAAATEAERAAVGRQIETRAALRARLIRAATGYVPFLTSTRVRDAYCRAARP